MKLWFPRLAVRRFRRCHCLAATASRQMRPQRAAEMTPLPPDHRASIWPPCTPCAACSAVRRECRSPQIWIRSCTFPPVQPEWPWPTLPPEWVWKQPGSPCPWQHRQPLRRYAMCEPKRSLQRARSRETKRPENCVKKIPPLLSRRPRWLRARVSYASSTRRLAASRPCW